MIERRVPAATIVGAAATTAAAALAPIGLDPHLQSTLTDLLVVYTLAQCWNLLAGFAGILSVGQQAFVGVGAYTVAVLVDDASVNPLASIALAGAAALVFALPLGWLMFRLRGVYLAVGSWVIAEALRLVVVNSDWLGGGAGRSIRGFNVYSPGSRLDLLYWSAAAAAALSTLAIYLILRSRLGLALQAIRDDETAARSLGVSARRTKFAAFGVAAFFTGIAGAVLFAADLRVQPESAFSLQWAAVMVFVAVIGGLGQLEGPMVGIVVYYLITERITDQAGTQLLLLGVAAVVLMAAMPSGLWHPLSRRGRVALFPVHNRLADGCETRRRSPGIPQPRTGLDQRKEG